VLLGDGLRVAQRRARAKPHSLAPPHAAPQAYPRKEPGANQP
jgi:hypothetical protein